MSEATELVVEQDAAALASRVGSAVTAVLEEELAHNGIAHLVLTGGTIGTALLTEIDAKNALDWERIHVWWGDERWVDEDSTERNAVQARKGFLDRVTIPSRNIHEMPAEDSGLTLGEAAQAYASELARAGWNNLSTDGLLPHFAVLLLGVGPDAHVASLFPEHPAAENVTDTVTTVRNSPKMPPERLSLTFPTIDSADRVWIVASGSDKAEAVRAALTLCDPVSAPVSAVHGRQETKLFADSEAAALVIQA